MEPVPRKEPQEKKSFGKLLLSGLKKFFHFFQKITHLKKAPAIAVLVVIVLIILGIVLAPLITTHHEITSNSVDQRMEDIGELATQVAYVTVVNKDASKADLFGIEIPLTDSQYIFSYDVTVKAGLDFAEIVLDVNDENKVITVTLPDTKVLSSTIDLDSLEIYDESSNIFNPLKISKVNANQQTMTEQGTEKAIKMGILEAAQENAEMLLTNMLYVSYPSSEWTIEFKD
jgi:hypothetical protein